MNAENNRNEYKRELTDKLEKSVVLPFNKKVPVKVPVKLTKNESKLFELLKTKGALTAIEFAAILGVDERTIKRGIKKLRNDNLIERTGSDKSGEWKII